MGFVRLCAAVLAFNLAFAAGQPQSAETFKVYTEGPRLLLRAQRLRLLKRESERKTIRWEQFQTLMAGNARMPEPAFASALYAMVRDDPKSARQAIDAALRPGTGTRELALVYDWLRDKLSPVQEKSFRERLTRAAESQPGNIQAARDRAFAAIAITGEDDGLAERALSGTVQTWWRKTFAPALQSGTGRLSGRDLYAAYELFHVIRDNLNIDLREDAPDFFKPLPGAYLLSHYPAPYPAAENDYRIPSYKGPGEPDLDAAALSRAAGMSMVAFDNNATDSQFLQGWLMIDHFILRGAFGVPYEFLWANPYQPGLAYFHFPLWHHDPNGTLLLRSSWEDDADWFGLVDGQYQMFHDGKITLLNPALKQTPIDLGKHRLLAAPVPLRLEVEPEDEGVLFLVGLQPMQRYCVEADDEEMWDNRTDRHGTLEIPMAAGAKAAIRVNRCH